MEVALRLGADHVLSYLPEFSHLHLTQSGPQTPTASPDSAKKSATSSSGEYSYDWVEKVKVITGGKGVDIVYDSLGGEFTNYSMKCMAWCGRLIIVGFVAGGIPRIATNYLLLKNLSLVGLHWGPHTWMEPQTIERCWQELYEWLRQEKIDPLVGKSWDRLEDLPTALKAFPARQAVGKIILCPFGPSSASASALPAARL
jgi:NADPH2:quinone reductase